MSDEYWAERNRQLGDRQGPVQMPLKNICKFGWNDCIETNPKVCEICFPSEYIEEEK